MLQQESERYIQNIIRLLPFDCSANIIIARSVHAKNYVAK